MSTKFFFLYVAMFSTMLSICNDRTKFNETPSPLFKGLGISVRRPSLVVRPINVYVDQSFRHEPPISIPDSTSNEGNLVESSSDSFYGFGGMLLLLSDSTLHHRRELVNIGNNTDYTASYLHATVISLFAGSYALCWFFTWDMNRNHRLVPQEYKIRILDSYYGVVSFSVLVWIQKVVGTPTNVKDTAWWIELICWAGYSIVLLMTFTIHNPITDSGLLDIAIGIGSSCFIYSYISKWHAVPFYTIICCLIFIRNHFEDFLIVVRRKLKMSPSSKGLPQSVIDVEEHSNCLPAFSPLRAGLSQSTVGNSRPRPWANQQESNSLLPPLITQQESNINPPAIDEQGIERPLPEIIESVFHRQVINLPSMGSRSNGCNQAAEMEIEYVDSLRSLFAEGVAEVEIEYGDSLRLLFAEEVAEMEIEYGDNLRSLFAEGVAEVEIEYGDSLRLLFAEEVAEMEIEYGDSFRLQFAEEVVVHTLICTLYGILILAVHVHIYTR